MASHEGIFETLARHLTLALGPLRIAVSDPVQFRMLLNRLGWNPTGVPPSYASLDVSIGNAQIKLDAAGPLAPFTQILDLVVAMKGGFDAIQAITVAPPGVDAAAYLAEIKTRLTDRLITDYLAAQLPAAFNLLSLVNVIRKTPHASTGTRRSYIQVDFQWPELPKLISDPGSIAARAFGWGTPGFQVEQALNRIGEYLFALDFPVRFQAPDPELIQAYAGTGRQFQPTPSLHIPFFYIEIAGQQREVSFVIHALPPAPGKLPGIVLEPRIPSEFPLKLRLADDIDMSMRAGTNAADLLGIMIRPNEAALRYPFAPGAKPPHGGIGVGFTFAPKEPRIVLGNRGSTRLEFSGGSIELGANLVNEGIDVVLAAQLSGLALVLTTGESDGFISSLLGDLEARIDIPLGLEWSSRFGARFKGSAAFEVAVHPHLSIGPVKVDDVVLRVTAPTGGAPKIVVDVGASLAGEFGPLKFVVNGIGLRTNLTFNRGNFGPFDLDIGFKPPTGVGLEVDAGGFKGGGFLNFDEAKREYSGGLELEWLAVVNVRAIGILSTKMPDGSKGFSLLIIIVAEFTPIQLSWGFTLVGVGGLLGLNRTTDFEALAAGVHDGALNSILFPRDIVANAPRLIADLRRVFPPAPDRFLIGPMAKLGWGTPTMISLELGLLLEIPRPAFAILGVLRVNMPTEDLPLMHLQVNFVGIVDFGKGQLSFDASIIDSRLVQFTLTGDIAIRVYWGEKANFLLSAGGFHPAYTPPPMGLGPMDRLAMTLFPGNPQVRAEVYFAVTSNTVQFGAKLEVQYGIDLFNVFGFISLDLLIQFNPFHFIAEITGMLGVRTGSRVLMGIRLQFVLEGPTPWHARGTASFEISFIITVTIPVSFDVTAGDSRTETLPSIDVLPRLKEAMETPANWRAVMPPASFVHVTMREIKAPPDAILLHPSGRLIIEQKVVPLNIAIQRLGTQPLGDGGFYRVSELKFGTVVVPNAPVREQFAPAQYFDLNDSDKLSRRSFDTYDAGVEAAGSDRPVTDFFRKLEVVYEVSYIPKRQARVFLKLAKMLLDPFLRGGSAANSALSQKKTSASVLGAQKVTHTGDSFAIASTRDLSPHVAQTYASQAEAFHALNGMIAADASLAAQLQVLPAYEVRN